MTKLTIEQRFALQRARYEVSRMSRNALERTALRLLKTRMEQKNGVQETLMANGIMFRISNCTWFVFGSMTGSPHHSASSLPCAMHTLPNTSHLWVPNII